MADVREYHISLNVGERLTLSTPVRFVLVSDVSDPIELRWNESSSQVRPGNGDKVTIRGPSQDPVTDLEVINVSGATATATLTAGPEADYVPRTIGQVDSIQDPVTVDQIQSPVENVATGGVPSQATTLQGSGNVSIGASSTVTIGADSTRHEMTIQANANNGAPLIVQDKNGNDMAQLEAGQSMTVPGKDEVGVFNTGSGTNEMIYMEAKD
jgi:hypothetical protein